METFYLIDYENVGIDGLAGCDKLNKTDHIIIFFTKNAKKIDMSEIANHGSSDIDMIEVPAGKQSADIHIGSYLGYLAGKNNGADCSVVIISKDSDFDNVISFWKNKTGVKASRAQQIKVSTPKATTAKQATAPKKNAKVDGNKKTKLNQEIMQAVRAGGFDASVANTVAQLASGLYGVEHLTVEVHNALREKYSNYLEVYEAIKAVLSKYDNTIKTSTTKATTTKTTITKTTTTKTKPNEASSQDKTKLNTEIMQTLAKAGYGNDIITYVASTVVKNINVKNEKQQIYQTIRSKYGQAKGLTIYNQIKKKI